MCYQMINPPEYAKVNNKKYKINTDFRIALECEKIAKDTSVSEQERTLAIIYKLFGDEGIESKEDWNELSKIAVKYLNCNNSDLPKKSINKEPDIDYEQDESYIKASFMSDYKINLSKVSLHWWDFFNLLNGLT